MNNKNKKIRVKLLSYDHRIIDASVKKIISSAENAGATVRGPIPLPTDRSVITILRATHKYKDSREQFEMKTHKRILDIIVTDNNADKTYQSLSHLSLPSGVALEVKTIM